TGAIGGLSTQGRVDSIAGRYVQGCGTNGSGSFVANQANQSNLSADQFGMGVGLTKGTGSFSISGNGNKLYAGLVYGDPRQGYTSVSFAAGFGSRAFAGGGVGIADVTGDQNEIYGSHFFGGDAKGSSRDMRQFYKYERKLSWRLSRLDPFSFSLLICPSVHAFVQAAAEVTNFPVQVETPEGGTPASNSISDLF